METAMNYLPGECSPECTPSQDQPPCLLFPRLLRDFGTCAI